MSATLNELVDENRALKQSLADRDARMSQHLQRISELERQIETLLTQLQGATRDRKVLEARLKELLAKRLA